jgi:periplasmic protein CpxP/Spy
MTHKTKLRSYLATALAALTLLAAGSTHSKAQVQTQEPAANQQAQLPLGQQQMAPLAELNLTPDQIQKIRAINADLRDQRQAANQRLRLAQRALADAVESPNPNEAMIEQRSHEVADAQAATIRLRALTESRVLQVLTPEQKVKLREIRARNQAILREQRIQNNQRQGTLRRPNAFQRGKLGPKGKAGVNKTAQQKPQP